jgi:hypothetical protein
MSSRGETIESFCIRKIAGTKIMCKKLYSMKLNNINHIRLGYHRKQHLLLSLVRLILYDEMIPILVKHIDKSGRYDTQLLQTIRMLKVYSNT